MSRQCSRTIGDKVAVVGQPLTIDVLASDLNQDALTFNLTSVPALPAGAGITQSTVYGRATIDWPAVASGHVRSDRGGGRRWQ